MFNRALPLKPQQDAGKESAPAASGAAVSSTAVSAPRMTLTVEEAADELHISRPVAYELVKEPDFPSFKIGKRILVNRLGLQRWIDYQSVQPLSDLTEPAA